MRNLCIAFTVLSCTTLFGGVPLRIFNTFHLSPGSGTAEIEWVSPSTFHLVRTWTARPAMRKPDGLKPVAVSVEEQGAKYIFKTRYLVVGAADDGDRIEIATAAGAPVTELRVQREAGRVRIEQTAGTSECFYGLGARSAERPNARGTVVATRDPFLLSTAGYGEFYPAAGEYTFDIAASNPHSVLVTVPGERVDLFFYFGPTAKEILEEHMGATGQIESFGSPEFQVRPSKLEAGEGSWRALAEVVHSLLNGSLSAKLLPAFDLSPYARSDDLLFARAAGVASLMPLLYAPLRTAVPQPKRRIYDDMERARRRLQPYLLSYTREAQDRGFPVIRPLSMDFGQDAPTLRRSNEFLLGDELLIAPVLNPDGKVKVYFPKGLWTDLNTGQIYKGRQEVGLQAARDSLPMFARNGTIVPLQPEGEHSPLELHYFPALGAEFFLAEEADPEVSQFHAAPAGDIVRLEIESRVDRVYDWVLHHSGGCRKVEAGGAEYVGVADPKRLAPGTWHFDAVRKSLRIRVGAVAGGDQVVNVIL